MATEKRLIDANAFLSSMIKRFKCVPLIGRNDYDCESLRQMLIEAPTVDAVEVVRCKDCMWFDEEDELPDVYGKERHCYCTEANGYVSINHFCACGERKDNERKAD